MTVNVRQLGKTREPSAACAAVLAEYTPAGTIAVLPFLGQLQKVHGTFSNGKLTCKLPPIDKGAAVWVE